MEQLSLYLAEGVEECFSWIIIGLLRVVFMQEKGNHFWLDYRVEIDRKIHSLEFVGS